MDFQSENCIKDALNRLGLEKYIENFIEHEIDGKTFLTLTKEEIETLIPGKLGPQKKLLQEIQRIQNTPTPNSYVRELSQLKCISQFNSTGAKNGTVADPVLLLKTESSSAQQSKPSPNKSTPTLRESSPRVSMIAATNKTKTPALTTTTTTTTSYFPAVGSTIGGVTAVATPIAVAVVAGIAKKEIICKYTAPGLNSLIDDKPEEGIVNEISTTFLPAGRSAETLLVPTPAPAQAAEDQSDATFFITDEEVEACNQSEEFYEYDQDQEEQDYVQEFESQQENEDEYENYDEGEFDEEFLEETAQVALNTLSSLIMDLLD